MFILSILLILQLSKETLMSILKNYTNLIIKIHTQYKKINWIQTVCILIILK